MPNHPTIPLLRQALPQREFEALEAWVETFYPFQQEWLLELRRLAANVKCRQIGGSHTFSGWVGWRGGMFAEDGVLVSQRDQEAKDLLDQVEMHSLVLRELGSEWAAPKRRTTHSLRLQSGAEVRSTTSTAAGRGFTGNVLLDEFAYMESQEKTWDSALAATMQGYSCRINSTPNGVGDIFNELCNDLGQDLFVDGSRQIIDPKKWGIFRTTVHQAIADGMRLNMDELWEMARHDPRVFGQLFECKFLDGNFQYFPFELVKRQSSVIPADPYGEAFGGLDIGETRDKTTLLVIQGQKGCFRVAHEESHGKTDDELIAQLIDRAFREFRCTRLCIDRTGMGTFPSQQAVRAHGPKVEPVLFGAKEKEAMAGRVYQSLADGILWLPKDNKDLINDVLSIRRTVTEAGTVRFEAPRTAKGHADRAWALMLAVAASSLAGVKSAYLDMKRVHSRR